MANTEGISDEALCSLLTISTEDVQKTRGTGDAASFDRRTTSSTPGAPRFPRRYLARREQMMELGEGERPAAMVIRSSKPPVIHSSSSLSKKGDAETGTDQPESEANAYQPMQHSDIPNDDDVEDEREVTKQVGNDPRPVILSESIRERPVSHDFNPTDAHIATERAKESRFKQRHRNNFTPTAGGFPSLDLAPVGTLTRKGQFARPKDSLALQNSSTHDHTVPEDKKEHSQTRDAERNGVGIASDSMLANMSLEDIRDGIDEITSILSPASVAFLRTRGQKKKETTKSLNANQSGARSVTFSTGMPFNSECQSKETELELEEQRVRALKEKTARILSSVRTPQDMDRAYNEALQLGLATALPSSTLETEDFPESSDGQASSKLNDIHVLTSLLRSTALRQRLLAAKSLVEVLESDFNKMIESRRMKSFSCDDDKYTLDKTGYPPLLPVALRCLLDDAVAISHTLIGHTLLSFALDCVQYLIMLFVHPYHLVCVNQAMNVDDDPYVLSQTCFMSEISNIPAGSELYPPTKIEPLREGNTEGCYRADSSSASAESDSKSFYNDPAWTLLSRMRIVPFLSDALICISKYPSAETAIFIERSVGSICGILALLSVRSPGAAAAISGHKGILPFIARRCLSPSMDESTISGEKSFIFRAKVALPALKLFCLLAQQSKEIAELETPFESTVSDVHAILCLGDPNEEESVLQTWSLILIRILLRYGLATNHIQSLIQLSPAHMTLQHKEEICAHYFSVFSRVCDSAMMKFCAEANTTPEGKDEHDDEGSLAMSGVWLASSAKKCVASLRTITKEYRALTKHNQLVKMKFAASQLEFLASYLSATNPSNFEGSNPLCAAMTSSFIPALSLEYCTEVQSIILNSPMLVPALKIALGWAFCAEWNEINDDSDISTREEAVACFLIKSYMNFNDYLDHGGPNHEELVNKIMEVLKEMRVRRQSTIYDIGCMNPSRQKWFVEAEFSVLKVLCKASATVIDDGVRLSFAFSLLGRLRIGDEAMSNFIFQRDELFHVNDALLDFPRANLSNATFLQKNLLKELSGSEERKAQLNHSWALHFTKIQHSPQCKLKSLRSRLSFSGKEEGGLLLPLGGIWLWNVLSSTMTGSEAGMLSEEKECSKIVAHALGLLLRFDIPPGNTPTSVKIGTKLYHTANVCLYPEAVLRDDFVQSATTLLHMRFTSSGTDSSLVGDFISACHDHSRISRGGTGKRVNETLHDSTVAKQNNNRGMLSSEELRALEDFVEDMCNAYIEYGGQYNMFTKFMRFFLRHEFPARIISSVLSKLQPVLNTLTLDEDRAATSCSLLQSVSGGLPSIDGSRRDPGVVLDSFSDVLKKKNREFLRSDYVYLLAVAVLSRNLSSSSQRCECGVQAMKHRLFGIQNTACYDIITVCQRFLHEGQGSKGSLIDCVMDICLNNEKGLSKQSEFVQTKWTYDADNREALWDTITSCLRGQGEHT